MNHTRIGASVVVVLLASSLGSCRFFHKAKAAPPPPLSAPPAVQTVPPPPPQLPTPPPAPPLPPVTQPPGGETPVPPPPQNPRPAVRKRPSAMPSPQPAPEAPAPLPPLPPPPAPAPELGQILTPQQQQEYNRLIDMRIGRAQRNLGLLKGKALSQEQKTTVARVQTFIRQAAEARKSDLVTAHSLAERADLLAQDLVNSIR